MQPQLDERKMKFGHMSGMDYEAMGLVFSDKELLMTV